MKRDSLLVFVVGVLAVFATLGAALVPPHLDFEFKPRMTLESALNTMTLSDIDFISEPGEFHSFADLERFFERQGHLFEILSQETFQVLSPEGESVLSPQPMRLTNIPVLFWIQVFVGFAAFLISGWVWSFRQHDFPSSLFLVGGFCILIAALPSAVYTTRDLALPKNLFQVLNFLNAVGGGLFGSVILNLFLVHPVKAPFWKTIALVQSLIFGVWVGLYVFRITWANVNLCIVAQMVVVCLVVGYQLWLSRKNHEARGALTWLGMSMIFGGGAFVVFNTIPVLLKITPLNQGYSFVFLLFIYLGIAAGLTQFRLFKMSRWAFYLCFYSFGIVAFMLLDAGFVLVFELNKWPSAILAFLLIFILYMPLGDSFWRSIQKKD